MTRGRGGWPTFPRMTFSVTPPYQIVLAHPLQLHKIVQKIVVKYLRRPMEYGYKQIVYQTITLIQEATASEVQ